MKAARRGTGFVVCASWFLAIVLLLAAAPQAYANGVTTAIGNGQILSGTVSGSGFDTYTIQVSKPGSAVFYSVGEIGTHNADFTADIYDPNGALVEGVSGGFINGANRVFNAVAGTYSVKVAVWQQSPASVAYNITVFVIPGDYSAFGRPVTIMSPGVTYSGSITRGSVDVYEFYGVEGVETKANFTFTRTSGTFDTNFQVFTPSGADDGGNYGGTYSSYVFVWNQGSGLYTVLIFRWGDGDGTVDYTVSVDGDGVGVAPPPTTASDPEQNGDPSTKTGVCQCGHPININSGNLFEQAADYETAGQNKLNFERYYNSQAAPSFAKELGANWRSTYDRYLALSPSTVVAERADGQQLTFTANGSAWAANSDIDVTLSQSGGTWTLTDRDDTVETYTAFSATKALLTKITARNGYTQTLSYAGDQLQSVTDSYGRSLAFAYDSNGFLTGLTTSDSTTVHYGYQSNSGVNVLKTVTYPTTPATGLTYLYEFGPLPYALTGVLDENGNRYATWSFDASDRALSSQVGTGVNANLVTVFYDDATGTRTVTNALGQQEVYKITTLQGVPKISEIDRLATSTTAAATRTSTYDANGYLASTTDWNGNSTQWTNDAHGQPTSITEAVGTPQERTTGITYHATFHLPVEIVTPGLTTDFTYDANGNLLTRMLTDTTTTTVPYSTNGTKRTWTYTWANFLLQSAQNPRTDVTAKTTYTYGSDGALTAITNAKNQATRITAHTGGGLPLTVVDPNNVTTTLAYDPRQRLTSSTVATASGARTTRYSYDTGSNVKTVTLPDGSALTNSYDAAHRLTGITDKLGNQMQWILDGNGDATQRLILDPASNTDFARMATFDALGRKLQDTSTVTSQSTTYVYDNNGNALTITDPLNHPANQAFDALNRLFQVTDAATGVATFSFDAHDRPLSVTAPNNALTTYVYDGFGDLIQQTSADSGTTVYHYDADGNLTQKVLAGGQVSNYTYDALDRMLTTTYPAATGLNVSYTYDQTAKRGSIFGIGRLTSVSDAAGTLSRTYDERGNVLTESRVQGKVTLPTSYGYDAASRVASITYPSGAIAAYTRDAAGRVISVTVTAPKRGKTAAQSKTVVSAIGYQPFGPVKAFTFGNGVADTRSFDLDYRMTALSDAGAGAVQNLAYGYDAADNVLSIGDAVTPANNQSLSYDPLNRLTGANGVYGGLAYTYDADGNRLTQQAGAAMTTYSYVPGSNRLASITTGGVTTTVGTNANGNITSIPPANSTTPATFSYSAANRLASVTGSPLAATFTYDAFGQRFSKANPGSTPALFSYQQDGSLIEENNNGTVTDYIYANGTPVATLDLASGKLYFLHTDHLGTPQIATDSSQTSVWRTTYQPFGTTSLIVSSITQSLRMPGQYAETEMGFYHNGFRDYMPNLGRFLENDPIGLFGGMNAYGYVGQNPVQWIDFLGLKPGDTFATPDEAARDATQYIWSQSMNEHREYAGRIMKTPNGYMAEEPYQGQEANAVLLDCPHDQNAGYYHTHPDLPDHDSEHFSPADKAVSDWENQPAYVGTPSGNILKYTPSPRLPAADVSKPVYGPPAPGQVSKIGNVYAQ